MAEPFLSEIRIFSFGFAPQGWALCNGQLLPINQNQALFSLLGTTYGGDGRVNFGLPDLQGRTPIHMGQGHTLGERGGEQAHTLSISELPTHVHTMNAQDAAADLGGGQTPGPGKVLAQGIAAAVGTPAVNIYGTDMASLVAMNPASIGNTGGSQAHLNMQPFLTLCFGIALQGIFPSQN
jgi:microcystin-dependent protein